MNMIAASGGSAVLLDPAEISVNGTLALCDPEGVLILPASDMLVVSDLHLEKGAAAARRGLLLPPYDTAATLKRLEATIARHRPKTIVSLGDSFHDRTGSAHLPDPYRERLAALQRGRDWVWIEGNHDPDAPSGLGGSWLRELHVQTLCLRHQPAAGRQAGEIAGHLHPLARVERRGKAVRRSCFASDGNRLIMPAFGSTTGGLDLRHPAFAGLFDRERLVAHVLGRARIYSVAFGRMRR